MPNVRQKQIGMVVAITFHIVKIQISSLNRASAKMFQDLSNISSSGISKEKLYIYIYIFHLFNPFNLFHLFLHCLTWYFDIFVQFWFFVLCCFCSFTSSAFVISMDGQVHSSIEIVAMILYRDALCICGLVLECERIAVHAWKLVKYAPVTSCTYCSRNCRQQNP